jgi:cellulose synthase operon protein C
LIGQGKFDDAITFLQKAYEAPSRTPQLLNLLTSAFLKANKSGEALVFLKSVAAKSPGDANALVLLGSVQIAGGDTDLAMSSFSAAVKAQPKNPFGYLALADVYQRKKDYDEAIGIIRKGLQEQPDAIALQIALANTLEQKGDFDGAISQYESILDNQPGNLIASNNLASLLLDHRTDPASLKRALSIVAILRKSQIPQFEDTLGWAKYREGDYGMAVSLCKEAAAVLSGQAAVRYHLGMSYAATNRTDKAAEELKAALELGPHDALAHDIRTALRKLDQQSPEADKLD